MLEHINVTNAVLTFAKTVHRELQGVSMEAVIAEILFWDMGVILILDLSPSEKLCKVSCDI